MLFASRGCGEGDAAAAAGARKALCVRELDAIALSFPYVLHCISTRLKPHEVHRQVAGEDVSQWC